METVHLCDFGRQKPFPFAIVLPVLNMELVVLFLKQYDKSTASILNSRHLELHSAIESQHGKSIPIRYRNRIFI